MLCLPPLLHRGRPAQRRLGEPWVAGGVPGAGTASSTSPGTMPESPATRPSQQPTCGPKWIVGGSGDDLGARDDPDQGGGDRGALARSRLRRRSRPSDPFAAQSADHVGEACSHLGPADKHVCDTGGTALGKRTGRARCARATHGWIGKPRAVCSSGCLRPDPRRAYVDVVTPTLRPGLLLGFTELVTGGRVLVITPKHL